MSEFSRRDVGKAIGAVSAAGLLPGAAAALPVKRTDLTFPRDFRWGCATAAYQIEGAVHEDGRSGDQAGTSSPTRPAKTFNGDTGDVADDSYHRYKDDTQLLKNLGVSSYRMSLAWSRIFPDGRGQPNAKGVDHYKRVVDDLLANGIEPSPVALDLPAALPGRLGRTATLRKPSPITRATWPGSSATASSTS